MLQHIQPMWGALPLLRADVFDEASIRSLARQTQVLINCVGYVVLESMYKTRSSSRLMGVRPFIREPHMFRAAAEAMR